MSRKYYRAEQAKNADNAIRDLSDTLGRTLEEMRAKAAEAASRHGGPQEIQAHAVRRSRQCGRWSHRVRRHQGRGRRGRSEGSGKASGEGSGGAGRRAIDAQRRTPGDVEPLSPQHLTLAVAHSPRRAPSESQVVDSGRAPGLTGDGTAILGDGAQARDSKVSELPECAQRDSNSRPSDP